MIRQRARVSALRLSGEQNHRCAYCTFIMYHPSVRIAEPDLIGPFNEMARRMRLATRDHYVAQSKNGHSGWSNLVAACAWCNSHRGNVSPEFAYETIQKLVADGEHPHQVFNETGRYPAFSGLKEPDPLSDPDRGFDWNPDQTWAPDVDPDGWSPFDDPTPVRAPRHKPRENLAHLPR